jgi:hypothetical protein
LGNIAIVGIVAKLLEYYCARAVNTGLTNHRGYSTMADNIVQRTVRPRAIAKEKDGVVLFWVADLGIAGIHQRGIMQLLRTESATVRNVINELVGEQQITLLEVETLTNGGVQGGQLVKETDLPKVLRRIERSKAKEETRDLAGDVRDRLAAAGFKLMAMLEMAPLQLKQQVDKHAQLEDDKAKLERQYQLPPTQKELKGGHGLYKLMHGKAYADRWLVQKLKEFYPALGPIEPPMATEVASLPTAKALLTPTRIAEELNLFYSSGNGNAIKVNKLLSDLGYQEKIQGQWSATEKAIKANLCDRKPVDTNSRTQKDQLLWSADIVLVLKEHIVDSAA